MFKILTSLVFVFFTISSYTQNLQLAAPPVMGHCDMKDVKIWIAAKSLGTLSVDYWPTASAQDVRSMLVNIDNAEHYSTIFTISDLEPGTEYTYTFKGSSAPSKYTFTTEALWQYRTDPPNYKIALGSCAFLNEEKYDRPGKGYGNNYTIFDSIAVHQPDLMLWLGDNVYFREVDFESKAAMIRRYMLSRTNPALSKLWSSCAHYAIWDDHDFGPNDSNGSYVHKDWSLELFKAFWPNPSYGGPATGDGITSHFAFGDSEFFLLDNRYNRTINDAVGVEPTILGEEQIQWLILALKSSRAPFKFVALGGQFLNTDAKYENYSTYPQERNRIIELIEKNNINGVIFLTGDRHCTELSELKLANGNVIYDLTVSPLTSGAYDNTKENNTLRVPETIVGTQNFGLFTFSGKQKERVLTISIYTHTGALAWTKDISSFDVKK